MGGFRCRPQTGRGAEGRRKKLTDALRWHLAWGDKVEWFEALEAETGETPTALRDRPELRDDLFFFWRAFEELSTDRQYGMTAGPIMFTSIDRYAVRYGISDIDDYERFVALMRAMDAASQKPKENSGA